MTQETKREDGSADDCSNDEDLVKASPVQLDKKKGGARAKKLIPNGSDDSDFGATVAKPKKPKKSSADKPPAAKKAKVAKPKKKSKHAFGDSSDEKSGSGSDFDISDVGPARDRPGRARKTISTYNFGDDSDSDQEFA